MSRVQKKDKGRETKKRRNTIASSDRPFRDKMWCIILFLLAFALYSNTLPGGYVLDDHAAVHHNYLVHKGISGIPMLLQTPYRYGARAGLDDLYRPFSLVMFAAEWQLAPEKPALNHALNILFYAFSCVLLFLLLRKIFSKQSPWLALFATFLWLAHPVHTEVVANIKSRDEIMSTFFLLLALLGFIRFLEGRRILFLILAVISYTLSFLSKEGVITCLLIFPLVGWYITGKPTGKNLTASAFMLIPAFIYLLMRQYALRNFPVPPLPPISVADNLLVAAPHLGIRYASALFILGKYFLLLLVPYRLVSDYSYNQIPLTGWTDPLVILSFLLFAGMLTYAVVKIKSRSVIVFGILFFLITMSIYSNLFKLIGSSFAERFLYLPSIGFCLVIAWFILRLIRPEAEHPGKDVSREKFGTGLRISAGILVVIMVLYSFKTVARNNEWRNEWVLFSADIERSPNSAHMHYYRGITFRDRGVGMTGQPEFRVMMLKAIAEFKKALDIYNVYPECYEQIGLAFYRIDDLDESFRYYQRAEKMNPYNSITYGNMGTILFKKGEMIKAMGCFLKAISLDSTYDDAYFNLGSTYGMLGQLDKTLENYRRCIHFNPGYAKAYFYMGKTYDLMNKPETAKEYFEKAHDLDPSLNR